MPDSSFPARRKQFSLSLLKQFIEIPFIFAVILATLPALSSNAADYQAEGALLTGVKAKPHSEASDGYRVAYFDSVGGRIRFDPIEPGTPVGTSWSHPVCIWTR